MKNLTTETPQSPETRKIEKGHRLLIACLIFLVVLLMGVAIYFIIRASNPGPKPEWWVGDFCFHFPNWNMHS